MIIVVMLWFTPYRNKRGHVVKPAPFQDSAATGEVARIEPNKKWFGKSRSCIQCTGDYRIVEIVRGRKFSQIS